MISTQTSSTGEMSALICSIAICPGVCGRPRPANHELRLVNEADTALLARRQPDALIPKYVALQRNTWICAWGHRIHLARGPRAQEAASCAYFLLGEVGTQSGGDEAVKCPVGQDARQAC